MPTRGRTSLWGTVLLLGAAGLACAQAPERPLRGELLTYPGPWRFQWSERRAGRAAFTTDEQFEQ